MIISFLGQKGGTGKSSVARAVAVEFVRSGWSVHVADMDTIQKTIFNWAGRRDDAEIEPKAALKAADISDLLVIDGKAFADAHLLTVAKASDLIVIPVGVNADDLEPTLNLATELINKGISRASMLFVVDKVPDNGEREAMDTRQTIKNWAFNVSQGYIPFKTAYSQAMDAGRTLSETKYKGLNEKTDKIIQQIVDAAINTQDKKLKRSK
ncbi:DNA-binding protein [Methylococcaceae bacterium HT3]|nr:DNA-binding protein [Methylococcaceae bacterium HT3]